MDDEEEMPFVHSTLPNLEPEEVEGLYEMFLRDNLPEDDEGDEDFEPTMLEEEEDGEENGVRRRGILTRELNDLLWDAYPELNPFVAPVGMRNKVVEQMSMHYQLLLQTALLAQEAGSKLGKVLDKSISLLESLATPQGSTREDRPRTRGSGGALPTGIGELWGLPTESPPPISIQGILPVGSARKEVEVMAWSLLLPVCL
ncbi:unnamed protein product [Choristocarpus tenellus]